LTFTGVGGSLVVGLGISFATGLTYSEGEGLGVYVSGGLHAGLDVGAAVESGVYEGRSTFDGFAGEACVGGGPGVVTASGCGAGVKRGDDPNVVGGTYKVGVGPFPATITTGGTATGSLTFGDVKRFLKKFGIDIPDRPARLRDEEHPGTF
jgi:hypothetical protein